MNQFFSNLRQVKDHGRCRESAVPKIALFGQDMKFHLDDGFPLLIDSSYLFKSAYDEMTWLVKGNCNAEDLPVDQNFSWLEAGSIRRWRAAALPEAQIDVLQKTPFELAHEYFELRQILSKDTTLDFQDVMSELQDADEKAKAAGKTTLTGVGGAGDYRELSGGIKMILDAGISLTKENVRLPKGYLGPISGVLWRKWIGHDGRVIDQLMSVIDLLRSPDPALRYSHMRIVTSFNPTLMPSEKLNDRENILNGKQPLSVNHMFFQLYAESMTLEERVQFHNKRATSIEPNLHVDTLHKFSKSEETKSVFTPENAHGIMDDFGVPRDRLSMRVYQHSINAYSEIPCFVASYALLFSMVADQVKMKPCEISFSFGETHIEHYEIEGASALLSSIIETLNAKPLPTLKIKSGIKDIESYVFDDFKLLP